ncbi:MAG: OmpH family outer membrane protein [Dysgonamonadaceae bacterium]|jgi:outer membrane protein|nr:OmpH family outer membrane protein [Dysgonamonadaceae bacterium]MDD3355645.1 OmpH family outer membrane protein [Dysgonamonadaceae bacterium]MDD3727347.1 OmpH family outer membrane protein [Dysgonamonadaceae bacterium]MDD4245917.1 OmpH family outer membrane protein [Dysgonamonadaceae bacterium]MDD4605411.1 OmpH family outer membrane protein [Dysgonamonadaceae bacterium]
MKKTLLFIGLFFAFILSSSAQKYALVDMEYILENIPSYENANQQLEKTAETWQAEIEKMQQDVKTMYSNFQANVASLSAKEKTQRENAIVAKENELQQLRNKYFGQEGEMMKRRQALIDPIQDSIYNAIKEIALTSGYKAVIDRASATSMIFASPEIDISNEVLAKLGYSK